LSPRDNKVSCADGTIWLPKSYRHR
jgi:hypothetical protein